MVSVRSLYEQEAGRVVMSQIRLVSLFGFMFCMFSLGFGRLNVFSTWFVLTVAVVAFLTLCWTLGAFARAAWVETIDGDHPDALGSLDMKERGIQ